MFPSLPQFDPEPDRRAAAIAHERIDYRLNRDLGGLPFPASVPRGEGFTARYLAQATKWEAKSYSNIAVTQKAWMDADPSGGPASRWKKLKLDVQEKIARSIFGPERDVRIPNWKERTPHGLAEYESAFPLVRKPESLRRWKSNAYFGYQRLAGTCPVLVEAVDALPEKLGTRDERVELHDRLGAALAEARVFQVDYAMLADVEAGTGDGWRKWLCAPIALFELTPDRRDLLPVAIQCGQVPGASNPVFFPGDGVAWMMARTALQTADSNYHGVVEHAILCHMVMGVVAVCTHRALAPSHPIRILLEPHLEMTIKINELTRALFLPDGRTPVIQSPSQRGAIDLANRAVTTFDWTERSVPREFTRRGVADRSALPDYPYRDDASDHWTAIRNFVSAYVRLYYGSNRDVAQDWEVQDYVRILQDPDVGGIRGIGGPEEGHVQTIAQLIDLVTQIVWRASTYHAAINYSGYDAMGFVANMPMAQYAPPPRTKDHAWEDFLAMLPPRDEMYRQFDDVYVVGSVRANRLGHYPAHHFADRRVRPLVLEFQQALEQIEFDIEVRNVDRLAPYEVLLPSRVTASLHI